MSCRITHCLSTDLLQDNTLPIYKHPRSHTAYISTDLLQAQKMPTYKPPESHTAYLQISRITNCLFINIKDHTLLIHVPSESYTMYKPRTDCCFGPITNSCTPKVNKLHTSSNPLTFLTLKDMSYLI